MRKRNIFVLAAVLAAAAFTASAGAAEAEKAAKGPAKAATAKKAGGVKAKAVSGAATAEKIEPGSALYVGKEFLNAFADRDVDRIAAVAGFPFRCRGTKKIAGAKALSGELAKEFEKNATTAKLKFAAVVQMARKDYEEKFGKMPAKYVKAFGEDPSMVVGFVGDKSVVAFLKEEKPKKKSKKAKDDADAGLPKPTWKVVGFID